MQKKQSSILPSPNTPTWMWLLHGLLILLPLKFGNSVALVIYSFWPLSLAEWLWSAWPLEWAFTLLGIILLIYCIQNYSLGKPNNLGWIGIFFLGSIIFVASLGWIHAPPGTIPIRIVLHWTSFFAILFLAYHSTQTNKEVVPSFFFSISIGIILLTFQVWIEYFITNPALIESIQSQLQADPKNPTLYELLTRLQQNRPQANFSITNVLAAQYILVSPLLIKLSWELGKKVHPVHLSPWVLSFATGGILGFSLWLTKSRAAILCLFASIGLGILVWLIFEFQRNKGIATIKINRQWILGLILLFSVILLSGGSYLWIAQGRTLSSLQARWEYWQYSWQAFTEHPWTGIGHGGFFPYYLSQRGPWSEITRDPHSLFYYFLSSCGILGGLWVLLLGSIILFLYFKSIAFYKGSTPTYLPFIGIGTTAWYFHAQLDMNGHIPAGILTLGVLLGISLGEFFSYSPKLQYTMWIQPPMLYITTTLLLSSLLLLPGIFFWRKFEQALENQQAPSVLIEKAHQASTWGWKNPIPWWSTANFLFQKHCFLEASYAYWEGLKCAPWYADAYFKLASIELSHGNSTQALQLCLQGLQLHPHSEKIFPLYRDILQAIRQRPKHTLY